MSEEPDLPTDVRDTLAQLLAEAVDHARRREQEELEAILSTVETVVKNKVPVGPTSERLEHGCATVRRLADDEPLVAAEYLRSMRQVVGEQD